MWLSALMGRADGNVPTVSLLLSPNQIRIPSHERSRAISVDVLPGPYRVHVEARGFYPADSIAVSIPPPVTDLHVGLTRIPSANAAPVARPNGPYSGDEGSPITFDAVGSTDPDGDALQYRWDFETDGTWDTAWQPSSTATHTWTDDFSGTATVEVSDGTETDSATTAVTVANVAPDVYISPSYFVTMPITLQIAGAKGNTVELQVMQDGAAIASGRIDRIHGSPREQQVDIPVTIDLSKPLVGRLVFDTGVATSGATPVWIVIDGNKTTIKTFNTQKNDKSSYHQTYDFDLKGLFSVVNKEITFTGTANDPVLMI